MQAAGHLPLMQGFLVQASPTSVADRASNLGILHVPCKLLSTVGCDSCGDLGSITVLLLSLQHTTWAMPARCSCLSYVQPYSYLRPRFVTIWRKYDHPNRH
jgi:hypothetical protein